MYRLRMLNVVRETDSMVKRNLLISQGYELMEDGKSGKLPEEMTLQELKRFAEENGVDISGLKTKKEIADAIRAAEEESDADDEGADGAAG